MNDPETSTPLGHQHVPARQERQRGRELPDTGRADEQVATGKTLTANLGAQHFERPVLSDEIGKARAHK